MSLLRFKNDNDRMATWLATGIGAGVAIGTATHQLALWMAIGVMIGTAIGRVACWKRTSN